eukprot:SAG11_NODE_1375_length_5086_cov_98.730499_8_plen_55_part_00
MQDAKAQKGPFIVNLSLKLAEMHVQYDVDIRRFPLWGKIHGQRFRVSETLLKTA